MVLFTKKCVNKDGFTLIEMIIVLGIIAVLAGLLVPTLTKYIGESKIRRAQKDVQLICAAIGQFYHDTSKYPVSSNWAGGTGTKNNVEVLRGPGDDPTDHATSTWLSGHAGAKTDEMNDQFITNNANYPSDPTVTKRPWKGPYLSELREDPWGNRYLVNVKFLQPAEIKNLKSVFVLSAGPNGTIDTPFEGTTPIVEPQDDDIVCRIK